MALVMRNLQRKYPLNVSFLKTQAMALMSMLRVEEYELVIDFVSREKMTMLNQKHRGIRRSTDVLSFSANPDLVPGEPLYPVGGERKLGHLFMCPRNVFQQAQTLNTTVLDRFSVLTVHGVLHCMGYDHVHDGDWQTMSRRERELLQALREEFPGTLPADPPNFGDYYDEDYGDVESEQDLLAGLDFLFPDRGGEGEGEGKGKGEDKAGDSKAPS